MRHSGLLLVPAICACSTFGDARRIYEMDDAEFARYSARTAALVASIAQTALDEGDITRESILKVSESIRIVLDAGGVIGPITEHLDLDGYGALALQVTLIEVDSQLDEAEAYIDEYLGDRGKAVLDAVAQALEDVAAEHSQ